MEWAHIIVASNCSRRVAAYAAPAWGHGEARAVWTDKRVPARANWWTQQNPQTWSELYIFSYSIPQKSCQTTPHQEQNKRHWLLQNVQQEAHHETNGTAVRQKRAYQSGVDEGVGRPCQG